MSSESKRLYEVGKEVSKGFADGIIKELIRAKRQQIEQLPKDTRTDKERQEDEAFARLKEVAERGTK